MEKKQTRTLLIFYLLAVYVILQFVWWGYYLVDLHGEIQALKVSAAISQDAIDQLEADHKKKILMVLGEGSVFIVFLAIGIWKVQSNLRKESRLIRLQQNFLLSVTHEIKSPIASVRLLLETLMKRKMEEASQQKILRNSLEETDRLDVLSDKILLATRIESKEEVFQKEQLNISELISRNANSLAATIGGRHDVRIFIDPDLDIVGDQQAVRSIFVNLFENACKYAPNGSRIDISLKREGDGVELKVVDEGLGIAIEDEKRIFEKFFRSGDERTRTTKGTGLGLYIVSELASQLGAEYYYLPNKPQGAIFAVKFRAA